MGSEKWLYAVFCEERLKLQEAIYHCQDVADSCDNLKCAEEHRQLANWLIELRERKARDYENR